MCRSYENCDGCPGFENACYQRSEDRRKNSEGIVATVEQWAKDHPVKTRQGEFLKMFPNTQMNVEGDVIWMCPKYIDESYSPKENCQNIRCSNCKREYWLEEVSE